MKRATPPAIRNRPPFIINAELRVMKKVVRLMIASMNSIVGSAGCILMMNLPEMITVSLYSLWQRFMKNHTGRRMQYRLQTERIFYILIAGR